MKRKFPQSVLLLMVPMLALVSFGCQPTADSNVNSSLTTNRNSAPEPINTASIEAELIKLEREWAGAFKNRDADTVRRILADDMVITYPDGVVGTKTMEIQTVETGAITADSWELVDPKVTVLDANSAFVTGRTIIKNGKSKDLQSQKLIDISGEYRFLDVYAKKNGKWQAVASQTTKIITPATPAR